MPRYLYLIFLMFLASINISFASKPAKPAPIPLVIKNDSAAVVIRSFNQAALDNYKKQPEFQYREVVESPSLWTRFWRWFWSHFHMPKNFKMPATGFLRFLFIFFKYFVIAVGIAGVVYVIMKMIGVDMFNIFRKRSLLAGQEYTESLENIHEISFDSAIEDALANHNYRLAVRLLYLKSLKQLSDASLIQWQPEKTNYNYINELTDGEQKNIFKSLTRRFEYVWYGDFPIDAPAFSRINQLFQEFKSKIA